MPSYPIQTGCYANTGDISTRQVVRTLNGDLHCVYIRNIGTYQICYSKSDDEGETWTETVLSSGSYYHYYPSIAVDSNDHLHVVWHGPHAGSPSYGQIQYRKYTDSWQTVEYLTSEGVSQTSPTIAVDSNDYLHVVWQGDKQIWYKKYTDSWGSIENIVSEEDTQSDPSIAVDSNDYLHVVWRGNVGVPVYKQIRYIKYTDSWGEVEDLTSEDDDQNIPSIAVDSNDHLHVVWHGEHADSPDHRHIRYKKYTDSWQSIVNLTSGDYEQYSPSLAVDSNDYLHVVWYGKHSGSTTYWQIRYIKYTDSWGSIENLTSASSNQRFPILLWSLWPNT